MLNRKDWYRVPKSKGLPIEGDRLHACVLGRYVTIFRFNGQLSVIDSVCYHASGPLTLGKVQDIEELGMKVVLCPWHKFMVDIRTGVKAYQGIDVIDGVPVRSGWKVGEMVQRAHDIREDELGLVISLRVPPSALTTTMVSSEAKGASNNESSSSGSSSSSSSSSNSDGAVAWEDGKDLLHENGEGIISAPLHCASDDIAFDSRCARPFHIHCTVTPEDKITGIDS